MVIVCLGSYKRIVSCRIRQGAEASQAKTKPVDQEPIKIKAATMETGNRVNSILYGSRTDTAKCPKKTYVDGLWHCCCSFVAFGGRMLG